jgi:hypothetical protein
MNTPQNLEPHEVRMVEEHSQLSERLSHLRHSFDSSFFHTLPEAEKARMKAQEMFMSGYESVLSDRLAVIFRDKNLPG